MRLACGGGAQWPVGLGRSAAFAESADVGLSLSSHPEAKRAP